MEQYTTIAKVGAIPEGEGRTFNVADRIIAVFNTGDSYHAIDDTCPHMGASLGTGHLEDGVVTCPWHAWRFKICDGTWVDNPKLQVSSYEVHIDGDEIQLLVPTESGDR